MVKEWRERVPSTPPGEENDVGDWVGCSVFTFRAFRSASGVLTVVIPSMWERDVR